MLLLDGITVTASAVTIMNLYRSKEYSYSLFPVINYRPSINLELQCYSRHVYVLTGVNHEVGKTKYNEVDYL